MVRLKQFEYFQVNYRVYLLSEQELTREAFRIHRGHWGGDSCTYTRLLENTPVPAVILVPHGWSKFIILNHTKLTFLTSKTFKENETFAFPIIIYYANSIPLYKNPEKKDLFLHKLP